MKCLTYDVKTSTSDSTYMYHKFHIKIIAHWIEIEFENFAWSLSSYTPALNISSFKNFAKKNRKKIRRSFSGPDCLISRPHFSGYERLGQRSPRPMVVPKWRRLGHQVRKSHAPEETSTPEGSWGVLLQGQWEDVHRVLSEEPDRGVG